MSISEGEAAVADAGVVRVVAESVAPFAGVGAAAAGAGAGAQAAVGAAGAGTRDAGGAVAHGFGLGWAAGDGFGVTSGRHDEREAKTPWYRTSGT
jgi:hypothetical protein